MMARWLRFLLVILAASLAIGLGVTGCSTRETPNENTPRPRIISHSPAITEILLYLGYGDHLVGVTNWCDLPEGLDVPRIGDAKGIRTEAALTAQPDLVLTQSDPSLFAPLKNAMPDLDVQQIELENLADIEAAMIHIAARIEGIEAETVVNTRYESSTATAAITRFLLALTNASRDIPELQRPKVMFISGWQQPTVAGPGTYIGDLIDLVGGRNVGEQIPGSQRWRKAGIESIIRVQPDILIVHAAQDEVDQARAFWTSGNLPIMLPAARNDCVFIVTDNAWQRPSPGILTLLKPLNDLVDAYWSPAE